MSKSKLRRNNGSKNADKHPYLRPDKILSGLFASNLSKYSSPEYRKRVASLEAEAKKELVNVR